MIDFRYHLVSIVAIFLSLAIGLVLGASFLQDPLLRNLKSQTSQLATEKQSLRNEKQALENQVKGEGQFTQSLAPQLVADRLRGESVVFVAAPGADGQILDQTTKMAQTAGATVTGRVSIQGKFLEDDQVSTLDELSNRLRPATLTLPVNGTVYDRAGLVLSSALVTDQASRAGREDESGGQILSAFKELGFLTVSGKPGQRATLAIVIAPSTPHTGQATATDNAALLSLAGALDTTDRGTVIGGPVTAAADGGLIKALRGSDVGGKVSSVDTAGTPSGQVVAVLALDNEIRGKSGHYGVGSDVAGYLPSPVPPAGRRA